MTISVFRRGCRASTIDAKLSRQRRGGQILVCREECVYGRYLVDDRSAGRMTDRLAAVAELWEAHMQAPFPGRLRSADVAGVCMVLLDSNVAGCVSTWLHRGGNIDDERWDILAACEQELLRVIPELDDDEAVYYQRLLDMAVLVLEVPDASMLS